MKKRVFELKFFASLILDQEGLITRVLKIWKVSYKSMLFDVKWPFYFSDEKRGGFSK